MDSAEAVTAPLTERSSSSESSPKSSVKAQQALTGTAPGETSGFAILISSDEITFT